MDLAEVLLDAGKGLCLRVIRVADSPDDIASKTRAGQDGRKFNPLFRTRERYSREPRAIAQVVTEAIEKNIQVFMRHPLVDPFPDLQAAVKRRGNAQGNDLQDGQGDQ